MKCEGCGADNSEFEAICGACGKALPQPQVTKGVKALAYILSILVPFGGYLIGAAFYRMPGPRYRTTAKYCIAFGIVDSVILLAIASFVMTLGFGGCGCSPGVNVLKKTIIAGGVMIEFTAPTSEVAWSDVTIMLLNGNDEYSWSNITRLNSDHPPAYWHDSQARLVGNTSVFLRVVDLAGNGRMSNGDYLTLTRGGVFPPSLTYTLILLYEPTMGAMLSYDFAF